MHEMPPLAPMVQFPLHKGCKGKGLTVTHTIRQSNPKSELESDSSWLVLAAFFFWRGALCDFKAHT